MTKENVMSEHDTATAGETRVETLKEMLAFQTHAIVSRMLVKNAAGNVTLFAFDEGEGLSEHTAPFDALLIGVEGEADVRVGAGTHLLGEGQSLLIPASVPHAVAPRARFKMLLVMLKGERKA
jgi:quercetin dioxygenase-like cupin family protein